MVGQDDFRMDYPALFGIVVGFSVIVVYKLLPCTVRGFGHGRRAFAAAYDFKAQVEYCHQVPPCEISEITLHLFVSYLLRICFVFVSAVSILAT